MTSNYPSSAFITYISDKCRRGIVIISAGVGADSLVTTYYNTTIYSWCMSDDKQMRDTP